MIGMKFLAEKPVTAAASPAGCRRRDLPLYDGCPTVGHRLNDKRRPGVSTEASHSLATQAHLETD